jgi:hypothetical protein
LSIEPPIQNRLRATEEVVETTWFWLLFDAFLPLRCSFQIDNFADNSRLDGE